MSHPVPTTVAVDVLASDWPSTAEAPSGRYDAMRFIGNAATGETVY